MLPGAWWGRLPKGHSAPKMAMLERAARFLHCRDTPNNQLGIARVVMSRKGPHHFKANGAQYTWDVVNS